MRINLSQSDDDVARQHQRSRVPCRTQGFSQVMSDCDTPTVLNCGVMVTQKILIIVLIFEQMIYKVLPHNKRTNYSLTIHCVYHMHYPKTDC